MNMISRKSVDAERDWLLAFSFRIVRKLKFLDNYKQNLICTAFAQQTSSERQAMSDQLAHMHSLWNN